MAGIFMSRAAKERLFFLGISQMATSASPINNTVTIACKLPHGLRMKVYNFTERSELVVGGGTRTVKIAEPIEGDIVVAGWSHPQNRDAKAQQVEGFALTPNVPKEFWDKWLEQNKTADYVRNGMIFAYEKHADAEARARNDRERKSGLERLDREKMPKGLEIAKAA